jgi:hypothetical protein
MGLLAAGLLVSVVVSGLLLGGSMLVVWAGRRDQVAL